MKKIAIGIDPGKHGSVAVMDMVEHKIQNVFTMPQTPTDMLALLSAFNPEDCVAYLEQVNEMPGQKGMFEFGRNYGMIETSLAALKISHYKVTSQKWQKRFQLKKPTTTDKSKAYRERKAILKAKAQEIFPQLKITLDTSDGLLIAEYAYSQEKNAANG